jgi:hypothetical protein
VTVLAVRLAEALGPDRRERGVAFDAALLRWIGCTATAPVLSSWVGDDIAAHYRGVRFASPFDPLVEI